MWQCQWQLRKKRMEEMHSFLLCPARKDALIALSVLDSIIGLNEANKRIVKAMDELQDFVNQTCTRTL
jgi:hypothetical protein